ncbi:hypothetical protein D4764_08G0002810 [Takifugu flavidus]|uniref:Reverse transcriptase domain-containing protein n=1 Tax=Takifugu flavidus TaxID=433684 RepID=A0A5C6MM05_9TELE|nr:hypothetical protein D4764_08G0002810 [Takifugu flavidus]
MDSVNHHRITLERFAMVTPGAKLSGSVHLCEGSDKEDPSWNIEKGSRVPSPEGYRDPTLEPGLGLGLDGEHLWTHHPQEEHEWSGAVWIGRRTKAGALAVRSSVMEIGFWNMEPSAQEPKSLRVVGHSSTLELLRGRDGEGGFLLAPRLSSLTLGFSQSSERVASLRLRVGERVLTVVCAYAPNNSSEYLPFLEDLGRMLDRWRKISSLLFADDVVLLAPSNRDLQQMLGRFATDCEVAGMQISTSKSEYMVLARKKVECLLRVGEEVLPQVEEFKYLGILFTSEGRMKREIDRRIGAASAVMWALNRSAVVKRELSRKARLSIYRSIYVPVLTYGHQCWVMTERTIQAAEMSFLRRVAGLSLRDRVTSSDIREELRAASLHREETRSRDYISRLAWERLGVPLEELMEVAGERAVWASLLKLLPPRPGSG